jgi:5'-deoxynucleotidase YfbR-like HD superfamily hydrolase
MLTDVSLSSGRMTLMYPGRLVDIWDLKKEDADVEAIAHALSNLCRYGGHIEEFYSVAEHSVRVASYVIMRKPEWALEALLHDAAEAFLVDVPRPIKYELSDYRRIEKQVEDQLMPMLGLKYPFDPIVKEADDWALSNEWKYYVVPRDTNPKWTPKIAKAMFLDAYQDISTSFKK